MKIGLVGLGKMGRAIAGRLVDRGFEVIGWDADRSRLDVLRELGQSAAGSAAEVSAAADIVLSIITDDAGVSGLFLGQDGFLASEVAGKIFVEMSTIQPRTATTLAPLVEDARASWIDSPVLGTIPRARSGQLFALAGGRQGDIDRAEALFSAVARKVVLLGPPGRGYATKLCVNLVMASYLQAIAESLALGTRSGIPAEQLLEILQEGPVASPWLTAKVPIFLGEEGPMSLDIRSLRKDMMAAVATGADLGVPMPGTSAVLAALSAAVAHGEGAEDLARHARFFVENMGQIPTVS